MRKFLNETVPLLAHFEHATVTVVGAEWMMDHMTSVITLLATVVIFILFQLFKEAV